MKKERTEGRRASDRELSRHRKLEIALRNFVVHYEDHPEERFAPRTRVLVTEARALFAELDALRAPRTTTKTGTD
ncbi:MAG: hypothetical protein WCD76_17780 [Pyrinomonadaceae bacterium]